MASALQKFKANDLTVSYTSSSIHFQTRGNRTGVFQVNCSTGDQAVLQARVGPEFEWIDVLAVTDSSAMQEVVLAPEFRIVVTNASGQEVLGAVHV